MSRPSDDVPDPLTQASAAVRTEFDRAWAEVRRTLQPVIDWANSPQGRAAFDRSRADTPAVRATCTCFCGVVHPSRMSCTSTPVVSERLYQSPTLGDVWVPVCAACVDARNRAASG